MITAGRIFLTSDLLIIFRTRIFHGVNAVYKIPPYHPDTDNFAPQTSLSSVDMDNLEEWGFTFVR